MLVGVGSTKIVLFIDTFFVRNYSVVFKLINRSFITQNSPHFKAINFILFKFVSFFTLQGTNIFINLLCDIINVFIWTKEKGKCVFRFSTKLPQLINLVWFGRFLALFLWNVFRRLGDMWLLAQYFNVFTKHTFIHFCAKTSPYSKQNQMNMREIISKKATIIS